MVDANAEKEDGVEFSPANCALLSALQHGMGNYDWENHDHSIQFDLWPAALKELRRRGFGVFSLEEVRELREKAG